MLKGKVIMKVKDALKVLDGIRAEVVVGDTRRGAVTSLLRELADEIERTRPVWKDISTECDVVIVPLPNSDRYYLRIEHDGRTIFTPVNDVSNFECFIGSGDRYRFTATNATFVIEKYMDVE